MRQLLVVKREAVSGADTQRPTRERPSRKHGDECQVLSAQSADEAAEQEMIGGNECVGLELLNYESSGAPNERGTSLRKGPL